MRKGSRSVFGAGTTGDDALILHTMVDRFCLTLRRIYASEELRNSAAQESRLRLADELHDTHVQTLTAIDLQIDRRSLPTGHFAVLAKIGRAVIALEMQLDELLLDNKNPRLPDGYQNATQPQLLNLLAEDYALPDIGSSIAQNAASSEKLCTTMSSRMPRPTYR